MRDAGRVVLVTGGAGGIGAAVAARFHAAGWTVRLTDLEDRALEITSEVGISVEGQVAAAERALAWAS